MNQPDVPAKNRPKAIGHPGTELIARAAQAQAAGHLAEARALCEQQLQTAPDQADALDLLGVVYCQQGQPETGIVHIAKACAAEPKNTGFLNNLGTAFSALRRDMDALLTYQRVLELAPDHATAHNNIATIYRRLGQLNNAAKHYKQAIALRPDYAEALSNYGNVLMDLDEIDTASQALEKAIELSPDYEHGHNNLGIVRQRQGRYQEAETLFQAAIELSQEFADAYANMAEVLKETGRTAEAVGYYEKALELSPDRSSVHSNYLFALNNLNTISDESLFLAHNKWDAQHAGFAAPPYSQTHDSVRKLRVGYVSPDFRRHSVSYFFEPLLSNHDPQKFEITCYSNSLIEDEVTARLQTHADHWYKIYGMSDADVYDLVRQNEIDILVDLSGHTMGNRLGVFARKPAPLQITYLGYPATTGLSAMDYRLTDDVVDPIGQADAFHSEKLLRLEDGFLCYQPLADAPDVNSPPFETNGYITFGSCNSLAKVTPEVVAVWAQILQAVPNSRLLLKGKAMGDDAVRVRYQRLFQEAGIDSARLDLKAWITGSSHLSIYHHMDIALDPFPYNGTTTLCETAWMGVPTVALAGNRHASRVGLSLNGRVGHGDLVAVSVEDYIRCAVALAGAPDEIVFLRQNMRQKMKASPLCDGPAFARSVEKTYQNVWQGWLQSR